MRPGKLFSLNKLSHFEGLDSNFNAGRLLLLIACRTCTFTAHALPLKRASLACRLLVSQIENGENPEENKCYFVHVHLNCHIFLSCFIISALGAHTSRCSYFCKIIVVSKRPLMYLHHYTAKCFQVEACL